MDVLSDIRSQLDDRLPFLPEEKPSVPLYFLRRMDIYYITLSTYCMNEFLIVFNVMDAEL